VDRRYGRGSPVDGAIVYCYPSVCPSVSDGLVTRKRKVIEHSNLLEMFLRTRVNGDAIFRSKGQKFKVTSSRNVGSPPKTIVSQPESLSKSCIERTVLFLAFIDFTRALLNNHILKINEGTAMFSSNCCQCPISC